MAIVRLISLFFLISICVSFSFAIEIIDPKSIDILLREIRARLQEKHAETVRPSDEVEIVVGGDEDGSGSGSGSDEEEQVLSMITALPILTEDNFIKFDDSAEDNESFPKPEPILDRQGLTKKKNEVEQISPESLKKLAPRNIQEHYDLNSKATLQMLQGLDIHGPSGGYHRAISGGYLPPVTYDPYNVDWYSYKNGIKQKDDATQVFRKIFLKSSFQ